MLPHNFFGIELTVHFRFTGLISFGDVVLILVILIVLINAVCD